MSFEIDASERRPKASASDENGRKQGETTTVPTYEYKCSNGHQYETREGFDAPPRQACPTCGVIARRVLFPPPIVFKGTGFYITDSRKGGNATLSSSDGGSSGSESKSSAKEDSKPAPATTSSESAASSDS